MADKRSSAAAEGSFPVSMADKRSSAAAEGEGEEWLSRMESIAFEYVVFAAIWIGGIYLVPQHIKCARTIIYPLAVTALSGILFLMALCRLFWKKKVKQSGGARSQWSFIRIWGLIYPGVIIIICSVILGFNLWEVTNVHFQCVPRIAPPPFSFAAVYPEQRMQRSLKTLNTIPNLKDLVSSNLESVKLQLERSHSEILKDVERSLADVYQTDVAATIGICSKRMQPITSPPQRSLKTLNTISDLKDQVSSNLESVKLQLETSHPEILKHVQKRLKMQTQAFEQVMNEAEKEYKKMSDRIEEGREAMKALYTEFIAEAQATASRLLNTSIPELAKTSEKDIASLQSCFGIPSSAA